MAYDRNELITIGQHFPQDVLVNWSGQILQSARKDFSRLRSRGITENYLQELDTCRDDARKRGAAVTREGLEPGSLSIIRHSVMQSALDWREEVKGLAKAVYDSNPELQARFRLGIRTSRSVPKLTMELRILVNALREHLNDFRAVGMDDSTVRHGEELIGRLEEADRRMNEELSQTPAAVTELFHALGVLYTRARFLQRISKVEFRREPDRLRPYSTDPLREASEEALTRSGSRGRTGDVPRR